MLLLAISPAGAQPRPKDSLQDARQAIAQGEFERAFDTARQVLETLPPNSMIERRAGPIALSIMANALAARGRAEEAESLLRRAGDDLARRLGDGGAPVMRIRADNGTLLRRMGRFAEAREILDRVPLTGDEDGATRHGLRARLQLADLSRLVGDRQGAKDRIEQVLAAAGSDPNLEGPRAGAAFMLARVLSEEGKTAEAYDQARRALAIRERLSGAQGMLTIVARALAGSLALRLERLEEAEPLLATALSDAERVFGPTSDFFPSIAQDLADLRERQQQFEPAAMLHRRAAAARSSGSDLQAANADRRAAQFFKRRNQPEQALPHYLAAITRLERIFSGARALDEGSRLGLTDRFSGLYADVLGVLAGLHAINPAAGHDRQALAVASQAQSRIFTDLMRQADIRRFSSEPRFLDRKERLEQARKRLAQLRESDALGGLDGGEGDIPRSVAAELQTAMAAARTAEDEMWRDFPRFMELVQPRPVTVDDLQQRLLRPGETLLSTATLPDVTLVFAVTRDAFRMVTAPVGRKEVDASVLALRSSIETASEGTREAFAAFDPALSHGLYRHLVAPLEPLLSGATQVFVVADHSLQTLPFEVLVTNWGEAEKKTFQAARAAGPFLAEYATLPWLANRYRFAYLPSLAALASERLYAPSQSAATGLVSFADPVFPATGDKAALPRLPETADEARAVAKALGGDSRLYLRAEANEYAVKRAKLDKTRYLHFATHGLLSGEFLSLGGDDTAPPPQPALALTMVGDLNGEDGLLTMREVIEELKLNSDLVVLSACNTAGEPGRAGTGEGFAGLTRAFMFAGAHGLVVSHWSVESLSAQELITVTFGRIAQGDRPLAALEAARRSLRGQTVPGSRPFVPTHPFFWAPFVYVGT
ncbi:CHAT domain-containing tetratricopeptide repeat protein [Magnetospirillum sp. XM-1]|uniref:CHAT domain-containing protein n=1 Tax=Magnetospirillum sp. XM-1 TaxID=1663591 RepID=UPI00083972BA|nr:CHAT domain-containing tetratricopeptide repeat protein [Magnetospirillum sp. XM-1]